MNLNDFTIKVTYISEGKPKTVSATAEEIKNGYDCDAFSLSADLSQDAVKVMLSPKGSLHLNLAELIYDHEYQQDELFYSNGFQSWTTSREYGKTDEQKGVAPICKLSFARDYAMTCGDYEFVEYGKGLYHGFTYCYLRNGDKVELVGSLNERTGYTIYYADMKEDVFAIVKDVEDVKCETEYELFNLVSATGTYDEVFDKYFEAYPMKHTRRMDRLVGYTSWYNYYQGINEEIILRDLEGLKRAEGANIFQIDDGYETKVGDWVLDPKKFPNGMKHIVDKIHAQGLKAGLWVAPFAAEKSAKLVKEHRDWFLTKKNSKALRVSGMAWGGFYALDWEKPEVQDYIRKVFKMVFDDWGFDMVKLDFLYAAGISPRSGKSRGQLMCEAMDFLRDCCGEKLILGCGVPLGPSFGLVDACRIGSDAESSFKDKFYVSVTNQEVVSTRNAMNNAIFRRHLNDRIFQNDPDVFFLRNGGVRKAEYNQVQKELLAKVNHMFGSVLFVSDDIGEYDEQQLEILNKSYRPFKGKILSAEYLSPNEIRIDYLEDGVSHKLVFNTRTGVNTIE